MKKRTLSTLLLAGVMAASMVPTAVFAAANNTKSTTVGYTAGGNVSPDGTVMVSVPMTTDFKDETTKHDFNVKSYVWVMDVDTGVGTWTEPDATNKLGDGVSITVKVQSENGFMLQRGSTDTKNAGEYQYTVTDIEDLTETDGILDTKTAKTQVTLGTLKDGTGDGNTGSKYTIEGKVQMTKAPNAGQLEGPTRFYDKLTYTFEGLQDIDANQKP